ncbi:kielin/chordin-like protein [Scylla paramamosain]|uniref:kielin/chordin-like protein n=1 Tax=Scylla paramamosain TaxID=85552 RepID=UPI003083B027
MILLSNLRARSVSGVMFASLLLLLLQSDNGVSGATCEANLECCRHPPWTPAFRECCSDGCCPDCDRVRRVPATKSYAMKKGCEAAFECCVYPIFTDEWEDCCAKHFCCPLCHMVSKGCCYNGQMHKWGSVVDSFTNPETRLMCGARINRSKPHLVATIVPFMSQPLPEINCDDCTESRHCVDRNGIVHEDGEKWLANPCSLCRCDNGIFECLPVRPRCPPPPYPQCVPVPPAPGDCCNKWDCSRLESMCVDAYGEVRQEGEQWTGRDDPCLMYMCKAGGMILNARRYCPSRSRVRVPAGCELQNRSGECCLVLHCPECKDKNGTTYSAGDSWEDPDDACYTFHCQVGGTVQRRRKACREIRRPFRNDCVLQHENCCPTWICGGCVDQYGMTHAAGTSWTDRDDPCITYICNDRGIRLASRVDCPPLNPQPARDCIKIKKDCCDEWKCPGDVTYCTDEQGGRREVGESWVDANNPCILWHCPEDLTPVQAIIDCAMPQPPPSPSCTMQMDQCCPKWHCPCVDDNGVEKVVGDIWDHPKNKCMLVECTSDGAREKLKPCPPIPHGNPGHNCVLQFDGCCLTWNCGNESSIGACPDPFSFNRNCFQYFDQCLLDSDCYYNNKCCLVAGCGHECMEASKAGECPVINYIVAPQCTSDMVDACQWDHQCPGNQKCCFLHCAKRCIDPF